MKIVSVVGARPQFIKISAMARALAAYPAVESVILHTGQHYDEGMSDVFFRELEIPLPRRNLGVGSGPHGAQTGRMLEALEQAFLEERPDRVVVVGDTNSTLAGALAAAKIHLPVAHVEAGLRSFNRRMPEELNRVVADHLSDMLFAPTPAAVDNLRREGISGASVRLVGDVMYDLALFCAARAAERPILRDLGLTPRGYVLATVHRAENTDDPRRLAAVLDGLNRVARRLPVVLPLHPRTRAALANAGAAAAGVRLIDPVGYLDMAALEKNARAIATDSGGVQKEACFYRVPCVTLRDETEWAETVELGANRLAGADADRIEAALAAAIDRPGPGPDPGPLYGAGRAAAEIAAALAGA